MAKRSKFFCIAVEGATCDGRTLDRNALQEMADTYAAGTYTARVNMEHIRGFSAEPPFNAYGDVVALETRDVDIKLGGKTEKKLGLFAQVDALDNLLAVQAKGQKLYSSIEINPNFAGTGKAYLQGLAVTDSPASLGTEIMAFAAGQVAAGNPSPFAERKIDKANFFSAAHSIDGLEFTEQAPSETEGLMTEAKGLFASMRTFFSNQQQPPAQTPVTPPAKEPEGTAPAGDQLTAFATAMAGGFEKLSGVIEQQASETKASLDKLRSDHDALAASIEKTDGGSSQRPPAGGGSSVNKFTFC